MILHPTGNTKTGNFNLVLPRCIDWEVLRRYFIDSGVQCNSFVVKMQRGERGYIVRYKIECK